MKHKRKTKKIEKIDMKGKICARCGKGHYEETRLEDDWDGILHCDRCCVAIPRYKELKTK